MKRTKHSLSNYKLATFDMGELVPVGLTEVLPGDTIQQVTSALLRVSPLQSPVMHPVTVRIHHWYVPWRLVWSEWEDFITGGNDGLGEGYTYPTITAGGGGFGAGSLADYFGIPPTVGSLEVNAMPFRAYNMIFNEYYRDQDLVTALSEDQTTVAKVAWEKDYFTAARPWAQRGTEVVLPLGTTAPVLTVSDVTAATNTQVARQDTTNVVYMYDGGTGTPAADYLYSDLTNATAANINDVRLAFALQRYQEARALYGARYVEYLRFLGIRPSDGRLQRPEYLGGGKQSIAFSEILQTGQDYDANAGVGRMRGHGISAMRSRRYRKFFEEHGCIMTLMSVRPRSIYADGLHRMWNRRVKEDYWQKELEHIGQQEILNKEVRASHASPTGVFGYGDRYSEYRSNPSTIAGDFRTSTMYDWHLARLLGSDPALNSSWVTCDPSKRIHQVQTNDVLWCMINHSIQSRRMVSNTSIGRIL